MEGAGAVDLDGGAGAVGLDGGTGAVGLDGGGRCSRPRWRGQVQ